MKLFWLFNCLKKRRLKITSYFENDFLSENCRKRFFCHFLAGFFNILLLSFCLDWQLRCERSELDFERKNGSLLFLSLLIRSRSIIQSILLNMLINEEIRFRNVILLSSPSSSGLICVTVRLLLPLSCHQLFVTHYLSIPPPLFSTFS